MTSSVTVALSAINGGIALSGLVVSCRFHSEKQEKRVLAFLYLLFIGVSSLALTLEFSRLIYLFHLPALLPILLAIPPTLYFYVLTKTTFNSSFSFCWAHKFLPYLGLAITAGYFLLPSAQKTEMFILGELPRGFLPATLAISTFGLIGVWILASVFYLVFIIQKLRLYRATLKQHFSNIDSIELYWIDWFMYFLMILWVSSAILLVCENLNIPVVFSTNILYLFLAGTLLFLIAFASSPDFKSSENLTSSIISFEQTSDIVTDKKYSKSSLSDSQAEAIAIKLEEVMRIQKVYLDTDLSLATLSEYLNAPANFVSQTLNNILNLTFYDYVAHWRVEAAKEQLRSSEQSITNVYLEVGFNSRSTFYKAFKTATKVTPKQYRERAKAKQGA